MCNRPGIGAKWMLSCAWLLKGLSLALITWPTTTLRESEEMAEPLSLVNHIAQHCMPPTVPHLLCWPCPPRPLPSPVDMRKRGSGSSDIEASPEPTAAQAGTSACILPFSSAAEPCAMLRYIAHPTACRPTCRCQVVRIGSTTRLRRVCWPD